MFGSFHNCHMMVTGWIKPFFFTLYVIYKNIFNYSTWRMEESKTEPFNAQLVVTTTVLLHSRRLMKYGYFVLFSAEVNLSLPSGCRGDGWDPVQPGNKWKQKGFDN